MTQHKLLPLEQKKTMWCKWVESSSCCRSLLPLLPFSSLIYTPLSCSWWGHSPTVNEFNKKTLLLESEKNSQVGLQVWSKAAAASGSGAGPVTAQRWEQHVGRAFLTWHQAPLWPSLPFGCFPGCLPLRALGVLGNSPHTCAASCCVCSPTSGSPCPAVQVLVSCWMGKRAQRPAPVSPCPAWLVTAGVLCHIPAGPAMLPAPLSSEHLAPLWLQLQR